MMLFWIAFNLGVGVLNLYFHENLVSLLIGGSNLFCSGMTLVMWEDERHHR